ncbi:double-strand break repair protein MRE11 [Aricia agestis]|uniref:double-strand break repair protein MRE11 n=1 Tax=Aricia agestis TaxID=91739 RepID=UPI001C207667|nr:double-strand break repair protein MRE11 [Aricia agestis]
MVQNDSAAWSPDESLRVLIASDIHLGYLENDAVRGEDSFIAFEEILSLGVQYDVDLILLGGDLFHHAKPSPSCMLKCAQIIRKYCFGDKPVNIEVLSDQIENFSRNVNYEDPNLNISYPIFSIHGNHDDPVGQGSVSSLDILSMTGLVNYFGKWSDYTHVRISPVLIQKGETKLSMYGLSHLKDQRLSRLFVEKKVEMEMVEDGNDWFNMLVLHQNRADRGQGNYIPESVLPNFLDLVVWGHEHDSQVFAMKDIKRENEGFFVIQPGSTVATSLAAGEALPKHCVLFQLHKKEYIVTPIQLKTVRPFLFKTIVLSEENLGEKNVNESEKVQQFLKDKVEDAIKESENLLSGDPRQPKIPLIRLSVFFEKEGQDFNRIRFGQNFNGLVANPDDVLIMKREKRIRDRKDQDVNTKNDVDMGGVAAQAPDVESLIRSYYEALPPERRLSVLSVRAVTDAVRDFTLKKDDDIFRRVLDAHRRRCVDFLLESTAEKPEEINESLKACKQSLDNTDAENLKSLIDEAAIKASKHAAAAAAAAAASTAAAAKNMRDCIVLLSDDDEPLVPIAGRGRGRGARGGPRGRARGRPAKARSPPPPPPVPERRTPRRSAAQKTATWLQNITSERSRRTVLDSDESE